MRHPQRSIDCDENEACFGIAVVRILKFLDFCKYRLSGFRCDCHNWLLQVDKGCRFVGHGLKKDFRMINIVVPQAQVTSSSR